MNRRTLLGALATGTATSVGGCLSDVVPERQPERTVESGLQRRVAVVQRDTVPERHQLTIEAGLHTATVTEAHTARLRVTTTNEGSERALSVGTEECSLFNRQTAVSEPRGLWLAMAGNGGGTERDGNAWVEDDLPANGGFGGYGCPRRVYGPGESVRNEYTLWHDGRVDGYLPAGTYRWETTVRAWSDTDAEGSPDREFSWGLSLAVETP